MYSKAKENNFWTHHSTAAFFKIWFCCDFDFPFIQILYCLVHLVCQKFYFWLFFAAKLQRYDELLVYGGWDEQSDFNLGQALILILSYFLVKRWLPQKMALDPLCIEWLMFIKHWNHFYLFDASFHEFAALYLCAVNIQVSIHVGQV